MLTLKRSAQFFIILSGMAIGLLFSNQTFAEQASHAELVKIMPEFKGKEITGFYIDPAGTSSDDAEACVSQLQVL